MDSISGCVRLAAAIVKESANIYVRAKKVLKRDPESKSAKRKLDEEAAFIRSEWFQTLTLGTDAEWFIAKLDEIAAHGGRMPYAYIQWKPTKERKR